MLGRDSFLFWPALPTGAWWDAGQMNCRGFPRCSGRRPNAFLPFRQRGDNVSGMTSWPDVSPASAAYAEFPVRDAQNQVPDGE